jgi:chromosome segregation ATPase
VRSGLCPWAMMLVWAVACPMSAAGIEDPLLQSSNPTVGRVEPIPTLEKVAPLNSSEKAAPLSSARSVAKGPSAEEQQRAAFEAGQKDQKQLREDLLETRKKLTDAEARIKALESANAEAQDAAKRKESTQSLDFKDLKARQEKLEGDVGGLADSMEATVKKAAESLKQMETVQVDFKAKRDRLDGISDLLSALRKDTVDNSQDIVELKRQVKALGGSNAEEPQASGMDAYLKWPYLPVLATVLAGVALALAMR